MRFDAKPSGRWVKTTAFRGAPEGPRCLLVDLDDTLFDHVGTSARSLALFRRGYRALDPWSPAELLARHSAHLRDLHPKVLSGEMTIHAARTERMRRLFDGAGEPIDRKEAERRARRLRLNYFRLRSPVPGAAPFLRYAHRRARVAIVSNNLLDEQQGKLRLLRFRPYVDDLVTTEEFGAAKPDPALFDAALRRGGIHRRDAVVLGDSFESDVVGARRADLPVVWFNRFHEAPPRGERSPLQVDTLRPASATWAVLVRAWTRGRRTARSI